MVVPGGEGCVPVAAGVSEHEAGAVAGAVAQLPADAALRRRGVFEQPRGVDGGDGAGRPAVGGQAGRRGVADRWLGRAGQQRPDGVDRAAELALEADQPAVGRLLRGALVQAERRNARASCGPGISAMVVGSRRVLPSSEASRASMQVWRRGWPRRRGRRTYGSTRGCGPRVRPQLPAQQVVAPAEREQPRRFELDDHPVHPGLGPRMWTCLQRDPWLDFRPTPELYDDLTWWHDELQVAKRAYWRQRLARPARRPER